MSVIHLPNILAQNEAETFWRKTKPWKLGLLFDEKRTDT
jgi:hypothetical protein